MWVGCYERFLFEFFGGNTQLFFERSLEGVSPGFFAEVVSVENSGGTCSPFLGLRIYYVLYRSV